jgi:hypothetical protein
MLSGFYMQIGVNFRTDKKTRLFAGLRGFDQHVIMTYNYSGNSYYDQYGQLQFESFAIHSRVHLIYLLFPFTIKQRLIFKPDYRIDTELGLVPGYLMKQYPGNIESKNRVAIMLEFGINFEKKLKNGNWLGIKFPMLSYSLMPTNIIRDDLKQYNYSIGIGFKLRFKSPEFD